MPYISRIAVYAAVFSLIFSFSPSVALAEKRGIPLDRLQSVQETPHKFICAKDGNGNIGAWVVNKKGLARKAKPQKKKKKLAKQFNKKYTETLKQIEKKGESARLIKRRDRFLRKLYKLMFPKVTALFCQSLYEDGADEKPTAPLFFNIPGGKIPNYVTNPDAVSVRDGSWFESETWFGGLVPTLDSNVQINHEVVIERSEDNESDAYAKNINIEGSLSFARDQDLTLTVITIVLLGHGELNIGNENNPVTGGVEIIISDEPINTETDPGQIRNGVLILENSSLTIHGREKTPFLRLAEDAFAGSNTLELVDSPNGWLRDDRIWLPDTSRNSDQEFSKSEYVEIQSINGATITLKDDLQFDHVGMDEYSPHAVNLTRNVILSSENPGGTRGHFLANGRADVNVQYAAIKDFGRTTAAQLNNTQYDENGVPKHIGTNQMARYSLHLHHLNGRENPTSEYQFQVRGNAIDGGLKWGITAHASHFGLIEGNVVVDVQGAGIVGENASETENRFVGNYVGKIIGNEEGEGPFTRNFMEEISEVGDGSFTSPYQTRSDIGFSGDGFWFRGANNFIVGNVVANAYHAGVAFWSRHGLENPARIPNFPGADPDEDGTDYPRSQQTPLDLSDNEVYASRNAHWFYGAGQTTTDPYIMRNSSAWLVGVAVRYIYVGNMHLDGITVREDYSGILHGNYTGGVYVNYIGDFHADNLDITGTRVGVGIAHTGKITNSFFDNTHTDINIGYQITGSTRQNPDGTLETTSFILDNVAFGLSAPTKISFHWPRHGLANSYIWPWSTYVYRHNGDENDNFEIYMDEQRPDFVMPFSGIWPNHIYQNRYSPVEGATNEDLWVNFGIAPAGKLAPDSAVLREGIDGLVTQIPSDIQSPGIFDVSAESISSTSAVIRWRTDEPATSQVEYTPGRYSDMHNGNMTNVDTEFKTDHSVVLTGLEPQTTYYYQPHSHDAAHNVGGYAAGGNNWQRETESFETLP